MMASLKSELRKIATIRSTYVILLICLVLDGIFALYAGGYKIDEISLHNPEYLANQVTQAISLLSVVLSFIGILLVTHEYRYSTILYTFTSSRSRLKVLLAKAVLISAVSIVFSLLFGLLAVLFTKLGVQFADHTLVPQHFDAVHTLARTAFGGWAFSMFGLILAFIIRSQVGTIAAIFLIPTTVESLLGIFLKHNQDYLPFTAVSGVLVHGSLSYSRSALVSLIYVVIGFIVAAILFARRDAN